MKYLIYLSFFISQAQAINPDNVFLNDFLAIEDIIFEYNHNYEKGEIRIPLAPNFQEKILKDPDNRIGDTFYIADYFKEKVHFWFKIYTHFTSKNAVVHDKKHLNLIYDAIDYSHLDKTPLNIYVKANLQSNYTLKKIKTLKKILKQLARKPQSKDPAAVKIKTLIEQSGLKIPRARHKARKFYNNLSSNVRIQTGQKDMINQGLLNIIPYRKFIDEHLDYFELPHEVIAISFLESSFNPKARSKVGASGAWQFMPRIGRHFMPMSRYVDSRRNPLISSIAAMHLLKENFQILKRWDLAITAYNSGPKHLIRARRQLKMKAPPLEKVFEYYETRHHGFASKNFYSSFLALVYALAYSNEIYALEGINNKSIASNPQLNEDIKIYVNKCKFRPATFYRLLRNSSPDIREINSHFKSSRRTYPRGSLVVSDVKLTSRKYYPISKKEARRNYPKNWKSLIRKHKCR